MPETMTLPAPKFLCPKCQKASRLPLPLPEKGRFFLTCAHCTSKVVLVFQNFQFQVEEDQKPIPPLIQRKLIYQEETKRPLVVSSLPKTNSLDRRRLPNKKPKQMQKPRGWGVFFVTFSLFFFLLILSFAYFVSGVIQTKRELPEYLVQIQKNVPTKILDRNGAVVSEIFQKRTSTLKLEDYPEDLISILLNIEDRKFFSHPGIDVSSIFRAVVKNVTTMSYKQGASTLTQQLARIILDDRKKSITRKIKEAQLAFALETELSKEEILELYMNQVYLGHGAFGFGEGIKFYFKKNPQELTREEMVLLASLPSAPNKYSPLKNPEESLGRVEAILLSFKNRGVYPGLNRAKFREMFFQFSTRSPTETVFGSRQDIAPYVTEHVRTLLGNLFSDKNIYESGGYTVETSLDKGIQESISKLVRDYISKSIANGKIGKKRVQKNSSSAEGKAILSAMQDIEILNDLLSDIDFEDSGIESRAQAAIVGISPESGEILFLHGGEEFSAKNQFNRALQMRRQTGSSIKAVLYASAIDAGSVTTGTRILDAPLYYKGGGGKEWSPDNLGGNYDGEISLRTALIKSKNTAAVQVAERLGVSGIDRYFSRFFFPMEKEKKARLRNDLSVALGSLEISPLEMASAFTAFVNQGTIKRPYLVKRILNARGEEIYKAGDEIDEFRLMVPPERQAIRPDTAEVMQSLLKDSGRASGVRNGNYQGEVAGKTGTTNDYKDAWFVGARPDLSMAVWVGYDNPSFGLGSSGLGGAVSAPLWGEVASFIDKNQLLPNPAFPSPIVAKPYLICAISGKEAGKSCTKTTTELFLSEHPPDGICTDDHSLPTKDDKDWIKQMF